jgi:adenine phosphoribosyltransferase
MDNDLNVDETIRNLIVKVADFPRPGINFTDITPILEQNPVAFREMIDRMCAPHRAKPPEVVVCVEAMGFVFGAPVAYHLGSRIVMARRTGKLPRPTLQITYDMGYERNRRMHIHIGAIARGSRVVIIDDVLAVGGTVLATVDLVEQAEGKVVGVSVAVELERFKARDRIERRGIPFHTAVRL